MSVLEINKTRVVVLDNPETLVRALADYFVELADTSIKDHGRFSVALSGGSTPKALYQLLATPEFSEKLDWKHIYLFLGDERCVAPDDAESNFGMVKAALLSKVSIPAENIFPTVGQESDPTQAAKDYEQKLGAFFNESMPRFDLVLLGLGPDGHTASLFPGSAALTIKDQIFVANYVEKFKSSRLTITFPVINNASHVVFLVSGESKAEIVRDIFQSATNKYPAQLVQPAGGKLEWYVDRAAAAGLSGG